MRSFLLLPLFVLLSVSAHAQLRTGLYRAADSGSGQKYPVTVVGTTYVYLEDEPVLGVEHIKKVALEYERLIDNWGLTLRYDRKGRRMLRKISAERINKKLAFVLDGRVLNAPVVNNVIKVGRLSIAGYPKEELETIKPMIEKEMKR